MSHARSPYSITKSAIVDGEGGCVHVRSRAEYARPRRCVGEQEVLFDAVARFSGRSSCRSSAFVSRMRR
jgi:hypothetical protein